MTTGGIGWVEHWNADGELVSEFLTGLHESMSGILTGWRNDVDGKRRVSIPVHMIVEIRWGRAAVQE